MRHTAQKREDLVRVTAWVPRAKLKRLMKESGRKDLTQSETLRMLIENELERVQSLKAHDAMYGIANPGDFDESLI